MCLSITIFANRVPDSATGNDEDEDEELVNVHHAEDDLVADEDEKMDSDEVPVL
jgi:hypothetical protein